MVDLPGSDEVTNGEPPTFDLYRSPSSRIVVLLGGLLIFVIFAVQQNKKANLSVSFFHARPACILVAEARFELTTFGL